MANILEEDAPAREIVPNSGWIPAALTEADFTGWSPVASEIHLCHISGASHPHPILKTQDLPNSARLCQSGGLGRPEAASVVDLNGQESPAGYWSHLGLE